MLKRIFCFALLLFSAAQASAAQDPLVGLWQTEDKDAIVEIYACKENAFCGRFTWLKDDSAENPSLDDRNSDPVLRKRRLCGLTFMGGFEKGDDGTYEGGWLYSARHGADFSASLRLTAPDTLELRGFVFLPFLGGGQEWHRIATSHACAGLPKK